MPKEGPPTFIDGRMRGAGKVHYENHTHSLNAVRATRWGISDSLDAVPDPTMVTLPLRKGADPNTQVYGSGWNIV